MKPKIARFLLTAMDIIKIYFSCIYIYDFRVISILMLWVLKCVFMYVMHGGHYGPSFGYVKFYW